MLNLLVEYARTHDLVTEPGFKPKQVRWALTFSAEGNYLRPIELGDADHKRNPGQTFQVCPHLSQPEMKRGGQGCRHFLVDNAEVVALYGDKREDPKVVAKHANFVELLRKAATAVPELGLIASTLDDNDTLDAIRGHLAEKGARPTDNVTFAVLRPKPWFPVQSDAWHDWWRGFRRSLGQGDKAGSEPKRRRMARSGVKGADAGPQLMRCFASGKLVEPAPTHPKIEGLSDVGGLSMGDALASFKQDAFCSFGLGKSNNAAVSEEMATTYSAALNHLIKHHGRRLAGAKVVHWYAGEKELAQMDDPLEFVDAGLGFLAEDADPEQEPLDAQKRAENLLRAIRSGERPELLDYRYYALTLSGASGRVMIRDWMEGQFEDLLASVTGWFADLNIVHRHGDGLAKPPKFLAVIGGLVRDLKDVPPPTIARMWRVAVKNEPIPRQALAQAFGRVKVDVIQDHSANHARMGLIKAYHIRKGDRFMEPYLNEEHPAPAYHCGRLMAVLSDVQYSALGDVGAGVVQRYYAAASSTPALVLGPLTRTSQHHISKIQSDRRGLARWYEDRIARIWGSIEDHVPTTLTLEEQSLFALGYYQQKAAKKSETGGAKDKEQTPAKEIDNE